MQNVPGSSDFNYCWGFDMVTIDANNGTLKVPDLGVTLRTLLACAAEGAKTKPRRSWKILYTEHDVVIGSVRIKQNLCKELGPPYNEGVNKST